MVEAAAGQLSHGQLNSAIICGARDERWQVSFRRVHDGMPRLFLVCLGEVTADKQIYEEAKRPMSTPLLWSGYEANHNPLLPQKIRLRRTLFSRVIRPSLCTPFAAQPQILRY